MLKILTIIGARPQIIKSAAISRAIRAGFSDRILEVIVHTGQHYDPAMSEVFFSELSLSKPTYNLQVGSGKHGEQTAKMITGIEDIIEREKPDCMILYGDTNSTLAGAVAGAKMGLPIAHIEAGLRSFNKRMPEEVNRILSDNVATYLFPPTQTGYNNLLAEGFRSDTQAPFTVDNPGIFAVGDVMYDNSLHFSELAGQRTNILEELAIKPETYALVTIHRNNNTDEPDRLNAIFRALSTIATEHKTPLVIPLHPRTAKQMRVYLDADLYAEIDANPNIRLIGPVSFLEMIQLEKQAKLVITDSGGVQKEAFFFKKRCLILRPETEWVEIVESGAAVLCDASSERILSEFLRFNEVPNVTFLPLFGNGNAAREILTVIAESLISSPRAINQ